MLLRPRVPAEALARRCVARLSADPPRRHRSHSSRHAKATATPPPAAHWFYAAQIPISKSTFKAWKPTTPPDKFVPFPVRDSRQLEAVFQRSRGKSSHKDAKVPVLEDRLFEVDITQRTLYPIYWDGPTFEVRRGTWFVADGSKQGPCPEPLAEEMEALYNKFQQDPAKDAATQQLENDTDSKDKPTNPLALAKREILDSSAKDSIGTLLFPLSTRLHPENVLKSTSSVYACNQQQDKQEKQDKSLPPVDLEPSSEIKTPGDAVEMFIQKAAEMTKSAQPYYVSFSAAQQAAWVIQGDVGSVLLRKLVSVGGIRLTRGYKAPDTTSTGKAESDPENPSHAKQQDFAAAAVTSQDPRADRQVDHLVICIHGIGQKLSERVDQVNFVQDINVFRNNMKEVFLDSPILQKQAAEYVEHKMTAHGPEHSDERALSRALSSFQPKHHAKKKGAVEVITEDLGDPATLENGDQAKTSSKKGVVADHRVQVIPLIWRHNVQFGMTREDIKTKEQTKRKKQKNSDDYLGPLHEVSLEDIQVDGILPLRNIVGDVVLDVLLYYQPQYHAQICGSVVAQLNRIFHEFCRRNPAFAANPHVSIIGHSLGSAIAFDIMCAQEDGDPTSRTRSTTKTPAAPQLDFDVQVLFGVGSPVGMFQLLKGNHIVGRSGLAAAVADRRARRGPAPTATASSPWNPLSLFSSPASTAATESASTVGLQSPKVRDYYNVFHPSDPVAYRVDALVDRDAASLPALKIPYTQGSLPSQLQELSQLATRFSTDAGSLWNNMAMALTNGGTSGNNNRSTSPSNKKSSLSAITEIFNKRDDPARTGTGPRTDDASVPVSQRLPFEQLPAARQAAVRRRLTRLNRAGQIDHALQEGVLDISMFAAVASHVSYFEHSDLASFVLASVYSAHKREKQE